MEDFWRDVRYAARALGKDPGFTAIAIATLALGIGANTAIFSVINAILLRPLAYPDARRLVLLTEWSQEVPEMSFSMANLTDVRDQSRSFEAVVGYNGANLVLTGSGGEPERLSARQVTSGLCATLGKRPILGRPIGPDDDRPGAPAVALLAEGFWERRFGRDPGVLGRTLSLNDEPVTVIGVMPKDLHGSWKTIDVFTPLLRLEDKYGGEQNRGNHPGIYVIARLKPGVEVSQARAEVRSIAQRLAEQHPKTNAQQSMTLEPLQEAVVGEMRPALMLLLGAVGFVLLIACANVANLLLVKAAGRQKEIALRAALGASRGRLLRQLLTESVVLSLAGGTIGILLALVALKLLIAWLPASVPRVDEVGVDPAVLAFTAGVAVMTGLGFGLIPAFRALSADIHEPLKEGGRGSVGPAQHRLRNGLVIAEIALALILLVGAGLLLRSFFRVIVADAGFRSEGILTANLTLPGTRYAEHAKRAALVDHVLEAVRGLPGVRAAAITLPLLGGWQSSFRVEGRPEPAPGQAPSADIARVSPDYFRTMGVRLIAGRVFDERDRADAPRVCVVDETLARAHWPGEVALGKRLRFGDDDEDWMEVVGVVAHVKNYGVDEASRVELYLPFAQTSFGSFSLLVRNDADPATLSAGVREAVRSADPELPVYSVRTLPALVAEHTAQRRLAVLLISVFAVLALTLAAVGIYGVMSYAVAQRRQEIGIRMALGAEARHVLRMVLRHGAAMALAGIAIGTVTALGLARLITSLLFETSAADPPTFSLVPLLLAAVAVLACYFPARRATRVDPITALRGE